MLVQLRPQSLNLLRRRLERALRLRPPPPLLRQLDARGLLPGDLVRLRLDVLELSLRDGLLPRRYPPLPFRYRVLSLDGPIELRGDVPELLLELRHLEVRRERADRVAPAVAPPRGESRAKLGDFLLGGGEIPLGEHRSILRLAPLLVRGRRAHLRHGLRAGHLRPVTAAAASGAHLRGRGRRSARAFGVAFAARARVRCRVRGFLVLRRHRRGPARRAAHLVQDGLHRRVDRGQDGVHELGVVRVQDHLALRVVRGDDQAEGSRRRARPAADGLEREVTQRPLLALEPYAAPRYLQRHRRELLSLAVLDAEPREGARGARHLSSALLLDSPRFRHPGLEGGGATGARTPLWVDALNPSASRLDVGGL